jgi:hypothetical protein
VVRAAAFTDLESWGSPGGYTHHDQQLYLQCQGPFGGSLKPKDIMKQWLSFQTEIPSLPPAPACISSLEMPPLLPRTFTGPGVRGSWPSCPSLQPDAMLTTH